MVVLAPPLPLTEGGRLLWFIMGWLGGILGPDGDWFDWRLMKEPGA